MRFLCTKEPISIIKNQSLKTYSCSELLGLSFKKNISSLTHRTGPKKCTGSAVCSTSVACKTLAARCTVLAGQKNTPVFTFHHRSDHSGQRFSFYCLSLSTNLSLSLSLLPSYLKMCWSEHELWTRRNQLLFSFIVVHAVEITYIYLQKGTSIFSVEKMSIASTLQVSTCSCTSFSIIIYTYA